MAVILRTASSPAPHRRSRARAAVAAAFVLLLGSLATPSVLGQASAATGTVKIDSVLPQNNNNPHQGCGILVEFYNWSPAGPVSAYVVFSQQGGPGGGTTTGSLPASGSAHPVTFTAGSGSATVPDGSVLYEVDTTGLTPAANGAYHVDVDVFESGTNAPLGKQKVITVKACSADLAVDKQGPSLYTAGGSGSYTIDVTNTGPNRAPGPITVTDTLPVGETATAASGTGWSCAVTAQLVTCTRAADLLAGASADRITVSVDYAAGATGRLTDTAAVSSSRLDPIPGNNTDSVHTDPRPAAPVVDMGLTKTTPSATVAPGGTITYTLTATNDGTADVTAFTLADGLGAGLALVSMTTTSAGLSCAALPCTYSGTLTPGSSVVATVVATVGSAFTGQSVTNSASVTAANDVDPTDDTAAVTTPVVHPRDLAVVKTAAQTTTTPGGALDYTVTVTNQGLGPVAAFIVTDVLPADLSLVSVTAPATLACSGTTTVSCTFSGPPTLAPGASVSFTVATLVRSTTTATSVSNTATVPADSDPSDDSSTVTTPVTHPVVPPPPPPPPPPVLTPDLVLTKSGPATVVAGSSGTWELLVSNEGSGAAGGPLTVSDPVPAGTTATAASGAGWSCSLGATVTCTRAAGLAAGQVADPITVTADFDAVGSVTNTAAVAAATGETDTADNTDSAVTEVTEAPVSDLAVDKVGPTAAVAPGDEITWTITVTNQGTGAAQGFTVTDQLADGLTLTGAAGDGDEWACVAADTVACSYLAELAPGASATLTVSALLAEDYEGTTVSNTVVVGPTDATPEDNTDTAVVDVEEPFTGGGGGIVVSPPEQPATGGGLPTTGAEALALVGLAGGLLLLGGGLSAAGRRRRA